jgi:class 3 adenylate cyclase/tetratricopeptide (TPR) repeat protein
MSPTLDEQIAQLQHTIAEMESQREALGSEVVEASLTPLRNKLTELVALLDIPKERSPEAAQRQRKLVTLLFMDVVDSTSAIAAHLDPEDTLEIMDGALQRLAFPITEHGGHVTRFMGDGFKAVFGAPVAREDDPEQAIRAGLSILDTTQDIAGELGAQRGIQGFQVRLGINTGLVALVGVTEAQDTIMGKAVNLAARLESAAPPGGLLISHDTYRHVRGVFSVEPLEPIAVKGFADPIQIYRVLEAKPRAFPVGTLGVEGVETRMVGRHEELNYLQEALYSAVEDSEGQVVTITGEAGVGKSRLLYEFDNWIEIHGPEVRFFQGRGRQETQNLPYALLRDTIAFRFQIQESDSAEAVREKVEAGFGEALVTDEGWQMRAHITGQLLGFDFSASPHLKGVLNDAEQLRNRGLRYLGEYFQAVSDDLPAVVILEDIHWADDSSLDAVNQLGSSTPQQSLLIVCAARPSLFERRPYWGEGLAYHHRLALQPLSKRESRRLIDEILRLVEQVPPELRQLVLRGAEGNPFYIEELIKMLVEDGVILTGEEHWLVELKQLAQVEVPATLTGVLQARLDSLPPEERHVLQRASVVGRIFWDDAVHCMSAESVIPTALNTPSNIDDDLTSLRARELIYRREESAFAGTHEYTFKHAVLRDVTYESVLKRLRKAYHSLVADWLIEHSSDRLAEYAGLIAEHLLLAGSIQQALTYLRTAGEAALASYANPEAENYFRRALELSPSDPDRAVLLSGLGEALSRQGFSDEALQIWREAIDLFQALGDSDRMADLYARSSWFTWHQGNFTKCWILCQEALALMENLPDSPGYARLLAEAGRVVHFGIEEIEGESTSLCQAALDMAQRLGLLEIQAEARITLALRFLATDDLRKAISNLEEVIPLVEVNGFWRTAARAHHNLATILGYSGDLIAAYTHQMRSVEFSRQTGDVVGLVFTLSNLSENYCELGDLRAVEAILEEVDGFHSSLPESQVPYYLGSIQTSLFLSRGLWMKALDIVQSLLDDGYMVSDLQRLAGCNLFLVDAILELNRFGEYGNYDLAKSALEKNLEIEYKVMFSIPRMIIVSARQGQFVEARDWLAKVKAHQKLQRYEGFKIQQMFGEFEIAFAERHWGETIRVCESLIEICQRTGHRWELARRLIDLADALAQRAEPGDQKIARQHLRQSLDLFTQMGAPGYVKVVQERLQALDSSA